MRIHVGLGDLVLVLVVTLVPMMALAAGNRHSGTVLSVGPESFVVDELGLAGKEQKLHIAVTPKTRLIDSERNPQASGAQDSFTSRSRWRTSRRATSSSSMRPARARRSSPSR